jgi:hypothetical protein
MSPPQVTSNCNAQGLPRAEDAQNAQGQARAEDAQGHDDAQGPTICQNRALTDRGKHTFSVVAITVLAGLCDDVPCGVMGKNPRVLCNLAA